MMRIMQSFLIFFYILDQCWDQCYAEREVEEDDLPWFLGAICPELWGMGSPWIWRSFTSGKVLLSP